MIQYVEAVEAALRQGNFYGALLLAVALPDLAGSIFRPDEAHAGPRYKAWWAKYLEPTYTVRVATRPHTFLGPSDAWALRCALLHAGTDVIEGQRAAEALDRFQFVQPTSGSLHRLQRDRRLLLQVDLFAADIVAGVRRFMADIEGDVAAQSALSGMAKIWVPKPGDHF